MGSLNEIVTMYLDYAERQARRGNIMYMQDWVARLDAFLQFNEEEVLHHKGKVTAAIAKAFAESEFEKYRVIQDRQYQSDFDRLVASTRKKITIEGENVAIEVAIDRLNASQGTIAKAKAVLQIWALMVSLVVPTSLLSQRIKIMPVIGHTANNGQSVIHIQARSKRFPPHDCGCCSCGAPIPFGRRL